MECSIGKLLVCGSSLSRKRLRPISLAAEKMAQVLKLDFEVRTFRKSFSTIYVYYEMADQEPIPLYSNSSRQANMRDVYVALRNMMFVLSFHPKHRALTLIRKDIMQFS